MEQRMCVRCGKPLPGSSKMTENKVTLAEAQEHAWAGRAAGPEAVTVTMCLQCQIVRAEQRKVAARASD
jgi:NMD protein affecting ribosome stability and mRNA decay